MVSLQELLGDKRSRGAFGEVQLETLVRNVLPEIAFEFQYTLSNGARADCVLKLPEPTGMVAVDSKFPLENYHRMFEAGLPRSERALAQRQFRADVKKHVDDIASKYIIAGETSDGAVMFVPAEAVFAEIHAYHPEVVDYAMQRRVWIVSPTTLMAVLNTARAVLKDVETRKQVHVIKDELGKLGKDFARFDERMKKARRPHPAGPPGRRGSSRLTATRSPAAFDQIERVELDQLEQVRAFEQCIARFAAGRRSTGRGEVRGPDARQPMFGFSAVAQAPHPAAGAVWTTPTWHAGGQPLFLRPAPRRERSARGCASWSSCSCTSKQISAAGGLELDSGNALGIAIQACILVLNLGIEHYDGWVEIIVYPDEFVPRHEIRNEDGLIETDDMSYAGQAWLHGPVILSWADVDSAGDADGVNVVIHEFAHKLDMLNGDANGFPPLHAGMSREAWSQVFTAAYEDLRRRVEAGEDTDIDPYATESPAEFFAVISEAFFEIPDMVRRSILRCTRSLHSSTARIRRPAICHGSGD